MSELIKEYTEVINLTKKFLLQNFSEKDAIVFEPIKRPKQILKKDIQPLAKKSSNIAPVMILFKDETKEEQLLLKNLSLTIEKTFGKTYLISVENIEKRNKWNDFFKSNPKLIITTKQIVEEVCELKKSFENNKNKFMLLPPISTFLKNPLLKAVLWKNLQKHV